jgi:hypothetical protein
VPDDGRTGQRVQLIIFDKQIVFVKAQVVIGLSSALSVNEIVCSAGRIVNCLLQKTQTHTHTLADARCCGRYQSGMSQHQNCRKQRGSCHIVSANSSSQSARADGKDRDRDSRWTLHRRKTNMYRGLLASMFDTDHQIKTFCVLTQHSTVG